MPVPLITTGPAPDVDATAAPGMMAAPMPFWSAVEAGFNASRHVTQLGARDSAQADALADRDADIRSRLGYGYQPPGAQAASTDLYDPETHSPIAGGNADTGAAPQIFGPDYEAWVVQQRQLHPAAMAGVPTASQVHSQVSQQIGAYAQAGAAASQANPFAALVGGVAGSLTDPANAAAAAIPIGGEAGLGAKLLWGTAKQAGLWASVAAAQAPLKASEAERSGGPAYTPADAVSDIGSGAIGGAVLHAGGTLLSAGAARLVGRLVPDAVGAGAGAAPGADAEAGAGAQPGSEPPPSSGPAGAGATAEPPPPSSSTPAPLDASGRFPVDASGQVVSDAGGPIQFDTPTNAARWILRDGHTQSLDQRFEPANHPQGGYTAREFTRAQGDAAADEVEPAAVPAAANAVEVGAIDDTAVGPTRAGSDYDAGLASLQTDAPAPKIEPTQDPSTLLTSMDPAAGAPPPSAPAGPGVTIGGATSYRGRPIYAATFDPRVVNAAPDVFQYKAGGDAQGVSSRLQGVQTWDPTSAGRAMVYEGENGAYTVADGHQRLALAKRLADQNPTLDALLFRSDDGWSPRDIRTIAALKNIREGSGSPLDAAKVLRDHPEALNDDSLPVTGTVVEQGRGLARLSQDAFGAVVNDVVPQRYAAMIGNMAPDRPDLHAGMIDLLHKGQPANADEAQALVSEALHDDWIKGEGETTDLFGGVPDQSTTIARAKVRASVLRSVRQNARLFSTLTRQADAIEASGNALARDANEAQLATNRAAEALISKLAERSGEVGDAMRVAAKAVAEGKPVVVAAKDVLDKVVDQIRAADTATAERKMLLDPDPPTADTLKTADLFADIGGKGQELQLQPKPEEAADEAAHLATAFRSGSAPFVHKGDLWKLTSDELDDLHAKTKADEDSAVERALGSPAAAKEYKRLYRRSQSTFNHADADEASATLDAMEATWTPRQKRLILGDSADPTPAVDEISTLQDAHRDLDWSEGMTDEQSLQWAAQNAAWAARQVSVSDMLDVVEGRGTSRGQAAMVRLSRAYQQLADAGVRPQDIPSRMLNAMVSGGHVTPAQASELVGSFVQNMLAARRAPPTSDIEPLTGMGRAARILKPCAPE